MHKQPAASALSAAAAAAQLNSHRSAGKAADYFRGVVLTWRGTQHLLLPHSKLHDGSQLARPSRRPQRMCLLHS